MFSEILQRTKPQYNMPAAEADRLREENQILREAVETVSTAPENLTPKGNLRKVARERIDELQAAIHRNRELLKDAPPPAMPFDIAWERLLEPLTEMVKRAEKAKVRFFEHAAKNFPSAFEWEAQEVLLTEFKARRAQEVLEYAEALKAEHGETRETLEEVLEAIVEQRNDALDHVLREVRYNSRSTCPFRNLKEEMQRIAETKFAYDLNWTIAYGDRLIESVR